MGGQLAFARLGKQLVEWSMGGLRRFVYYDMVGERETLFIDDMGGREIVYSSVFCTTIYIDFKEDLC
jgi:hypothetical protein